MKLTADELLNERIILKKPFKREGSFIFFSGVDDGDLRLLNLSIQKCRYYIFDVDYNL